jgi:hypothetical protein
LPVTRELALAIGERAEGRCEYCRMAATFYRLPFQTDHIIARKHGGLSTMDNLAFACCHCNLRKGTNIAGRDPESGELVRLFHPRLDRWQEHFALAGARIVGKTPIGRVTIQLLVFNEPDFLALREALIEENLFPGNI